MSPRQEVPIRLVTCGHCALLVIAVIAAWNPDAQATIKSGDWQESSLQGYVLYTTTSGSGRARNLLEFSCDVATGTNSPPSVNLEIAGSDVARTTPVEFSTGSASVNFSSGLQNIPPAKFNELWDIVRQGSALTVKLGDGRQARFSLKGSGRVMPPRPCGR